jgi:hypothetical protein
MPHGRPAMWAVLPPLPWCQCALLRTDRRIPTHRERERDGHTQRQRERERAPEHTHPRLVNLAEVGHHLNASAAPAPPASASDDAHADTPTQAHTTHARGLALTYAAPRHACATGHSRVRHAWHTRTHAATAQGKEEGGTHPGHLVPAKGVANHDRLAARIGRVQRAHPRAPHRLARPLPHQAHQLLHICRGHPPTHTLKQSKQVRRRLRACNREVAAHVPRTPKAALRL